jgi:hypothetical protein
LRAALLDQVVELSALGVRPWEIELLSEPELNRFLSHVADRRWGGG